MARVRSTALNTWPCLNGSLPGRWSWPYRGGVCVLPEALLLAGSGPLWGSPAVATGGRHGYRSMAVAGYAPPSITSGASRRRT